MRTFLSKYGYAVRMPDGSYRGVYRTSADASHACSLATVRDANDRDPPTVELVRLWWWQRYGARAVPMGT